MEKEMTNNSLFDNELQQKQHDSLVQAPSELDIQKEQKKQKIFKIVRSVFVYIFLTIVAIFAFLPFYWMLISSFKTEIEYRQTPPTFFPHNFIFKNYPTVLSQATMGTNNFWGILVNTLIVGLVSTGLGLVVTIITAYAFARMEFNGKNILFALMLGTMMIPGEMFTITNYLTVNKFGWADTYTVMILPFMVSTYYIYLLRNNFKQIPNSLYQAAKVDGLSDMGYLVKVMVPLTAPTLISITLLKFIGTWNSYIWPRLINRAEMQLITNWVTNGFHDTAEAAINFEDGVLKYGTSMSLTSMKMAAVCMVSLPLFLLFVFFRKYIMHGVSKSGTKG